MSRLKIGTHNGTFHADEVLACVMLKHLQEYSDAEIIRTRDPKILSDCDIVVDVGGTFVPEIKRFDHHQRGFHSTFKTFFPNSDWEIKLSSAGLVYIHYGKRVLSSMLGKDVGECIIDELFKEVYGAFVVEIDAIDNGIPITDGKINYSISTGLSARVRQMNPKWNQPDHDEMKCFQLALEAVDNEFTEIVHNYAYTWYPAREIVVDAIRGRYDIDPSGRIIQISCTCPWIDHFLSLEKEESKSNGLSESKRPKLIPQTILFAIYEDKSTQWAISAIPVNESDYFSNRLPLPESWRGLRDEELYEVSGIPDCVFVHATGFLGINKSRSGALRMGLRAIQLAANDV